MSRTVIPFAAWALAAAVLVPLPAPASGGAEIYRRETTKPIAEVMDDLEFAVTERNFRITGRLHIGEAVRERGNETFPDYEVILFCNVTIAEQMLSLNPDYVNHCPARIAVRGADGAVVISAPLVPMDPGNAELNALLERLNGLIRESVDFATEKWLKNRK